MPVLTVRITDKEKAILSRRARREGMKPSQLVRQMIAEEPFVTAADVLADFEKRLKKTRKVRRA